MKVNNLKAKKSKANKNSLASGQGVYFGRAGTVCEHTKAVV